jgi:hypothetical protein
LIDGIHVSFLSSMDSWCSITATRFVAPPHAQSGHQIAHAQKNSWRVSDPLFFLRMWRQSGRTRSLRQAAVEAGTACGGRPSRDRRHASKPMGGGQLRPPLHLKTKPIPEKEKHK